jgi:glycosyltransferase involved in cell wall biosynthesis
MRILWFVDILFPEVQKRLYGREAKGGGGWWMVELARRLASQREVELAVATSVQALDRLVVFQSGGITFHAMPYGGRLERALKRTCLPPCALKPAIMLDRVLLADDRLNLIDALDVVNQFNPDLVHVHGTEHYYGLVAEQITKPVLVTLQGILTPYSRVFFGGAPWHQRLRMPRVWPDYWRFRRRARRERRIAHAVQHFLGHSQWDHAWQKALNARATYHHDGAYILRDCFEACQWRLAECEHDVIYSTTTVNPYKGTDTLLEAMHLLRRRKERLRLRIGGEIPHRGYGGYLHRMVQTLGLTEQVAFLGPLAGEAICSELKRARVFVMPSFIENSPNSLSEAMMVGTPSVAAAGGGTSELFTDGVDGLLYTPGDAANLAHQIERLVDSDEMAVRFSQVARNNMLRRHDPAMVVERHLEIYQRVLNLSPLKTGNP